MKNNEFDKDDLPISEEYFKEIGKVLEDYLDFAKKYLIFPDLTKEEYESAIKCVEKAAKKLKKGKSSPMNKERLMEAVENGDIPEEYLE